MAFCIGHVTMVAATAAAAVLAGKPPWPFKEDQFLCLGLDLLSNQWSTRWKTTKQESQVCDFKSVHGPHPKTMSMVWADLQTTRLNELRVDASVKPKHLLLVHCWLKSCKSKKELRSLHVFGEKTI